MDEATVSFDIPDFLGAYRIESLLGDGGMGEVFLAWDERLQRHVALKRIHPEKSINDETRIRFRREARAIAKLRHPAIVQIHDILEIDQGDCIVMEYIEGRGLRDVIARGELQVDHALHIARQVAEGLAEAHDHGLVHRDLKADNVRLDLKGQAKILDFGLVRSSKADLEGDLAAQITAEGVIMGTVYSMSPEQAKGRSVDHRSDLFSLGVLLYEMLSGRVPFPGKNVLLTLHHICTEPPAPLTDFCPELAPPVLELVDKLLEKDPAARPQSAHLVAQVLADLGSSEFSNSDLWAAESSERASRGTKVFSTLDPTIVGFDAVAPVELKQHAAPELPAKPYPVLLPYSHPALLAGRERELTQLLGLLRERVPIVVLSAASGMGKSSLLLGALVPTLREQGRPTALTRFPHEPKLTQRLTADLLVGGEEIEEGDWGAFLGRLETAESLAGSSPVLVLDQFEEILRSEAARARTGTLLAASLRRAQGEAPRCFWILAVRRRRLGAVQEWLRDVLREARAAEHDVEDLPHDFSGPERMRIMLLSPLGTVCSGAGALAATRAIFQEAIERPLALRNEDGEPIYRYRFAPRHAARLAQAFAENRLMHPEAPLGPELQVVMAHLLTKTSGTDGSMEMTVPENPGALIETALEDHLRRALGEAFPDTTLTGAGCVGRTRALLALRELVTDDGGRGKGLPVEALTTVIGPCGAEVLEELSSPLTRLVVTVETAEGLHYALSHNRLAELVLRLVEEEGGQARLLVDRDLLATRRVVALESALFASDAGKISPRLSRRRFRRVEKYSAALLWDAPRRDWWHACRKQRLSDRVRTASAATAAFLALTLVAFGVWKVVTARAERSNLLDQVAQGEAATAFAALERLRSQATEEELLARLRERDKPSIVLELGLEGLTGEERSRAVLATVRLLLPLAEEDPENFERIANLTWALDYVPGREPAFAREARELRELVLAPLRALRPPPPLPDAEDPDWIEIPEGSFLPEPAGGDAEERSFAEVKISAFRLQRHEVTNAEYRRLVPDHEVEMDDLPARFVSWYAAYAYAAWLGGRLPTGPEWEYAARAGCDVPRCDETGREVAADKVAWTSGNSQNETLGKPFPHPVMELAPNRWGLYDMWGNLWEWVGEWYVLSADRDGQPRYGPPLHNAPRAARGGSFENAPETVHERIGPLPREKNHNYGFRVALPSAESR